MVMSIKRQRSNLKANLRERRKNYTSGKLRNGLSLKKKEEQLKTIYEREHQNIKGLTTQAFSNKIKNKIHNFAVNTLNSVDKNASQKYGIEKKTGEVPSEKEYIFFKNMLDLSYNIYNEMH